MSVLIQESVVELNEFVYSVDANLKLFRLPFISNLSKQLSKAVCLRSSINIFTTEKRVEVLWVWRRIG